MITVRGLRKDYGALVAVEGLDLEVARGEIFALLGPNGAGKTTTVEILEGYRKRSQGEVRVLGRDPEDVDGDWRARIGIVLQGGLTLADMTVAEIVTHFARFYPRPLPPEDVIALVGLDEKRNTRAGKLSGGQRRRLDLALGLVGDPELIFLDEPTTGFDPAARRQAWSIVRDLKALGRTVVLTTHYLDEAEHLADRVGVMAAGRLLAVAPPRELGGRATAPVRVRFRTTGPLADRPLPSLPDAALHREGDTVTTVTSEPTAVVAALGHWASCAGVAELPELSVVRPTLEDVYLRMVGAEASDTEEAWT